MNSEKYVLYERIGTVQYRKNRRAKNISIRINNKGEIRVTVPGWCSYSKAEGFVHKKLDWIEQKLLTIQRKTEENLVWNIGDFIDLYQGSISIQNGGGSDWKIRFQGRNYEIAVPDSFDSSMETDRETMMEHINSIALQVSKQTVPPLLSYFAREHGFSYDRATVRRMRSRWGSCSVQNRISLSSGLAFLPFELIEYVCLHELVHTVHKNHGQLFWKSLEHILPDALERRKLLRQRPLIA